MLAGFYGYLFGAEDSNDSESGLEVSVSNGESDSMKNDKAVGDEEDWFMVDEENARDPFLPEIVPRFDMRDIDELSFASTRQTTGEAIALPTEQELRKAEELRLAKAKNAQRAHLEKMLFDNSTMTSSGTFTSTSTTTKSKVLKRETSSNKAKSRSKKSSGKFSSGRNNDRKVNNID